VQFTIEIDYREKDKPYALLLDGHPSLKIEYSTLSTGDVRVGNLIIERKLLPDLFLTLNEDRLFKQLLAMKNAFPRQLLIIEGTAPDTLRQKLGGLFTRISAGWQIPILFAANPQELAALIVSITRQTYTASAGPISPRPRRKADRNLAVPHKMPLQVSGLGPTRARALLKHFGSVQNCLNANAQELTVVDGVGKKTAERFIHQVHGRSRSGI
jgi:ERCC4-type nuclease